MWEVNVGSDGTGSVLLAQLVRVIDGCVAPDPAKRWTVRHVLDALVAISHDVVKSGVSVGVSDAPVAASSQVRSRPTAVPASTAPALVYDVLAIIAAMEALAVDAAVVSSVADAIGFLSSSTLDVLLAKGVRATDVAKIKKAVALKTVTDSDVWSSPSSMVRLDFRVCIR